MFCILKAILVWIALLYICTNVVGLIVRGILWRPPSLDLPSDGGNEIFNKELHRLKSGNNLLTFISIVTFFILLIFTYYFWNILLTIAVAMVMVSRLPDLLYEIRTGIKVTKRIMPK